MADSEIDKWNNRCDLKQARFEDAYDDYDDVRDDMDFLKRKEKFKWQKEASKIRVGGWVGG